MSTKNGKRTIGLDMHPDVFSAAALRGDNPLGAELDWVHDRKKTADLEAWAQKHLHSNDVVVLEASGNSFEVALRLKSCGYTALVLESAQAGKIRDNFCNDDRHSAVKLAQVYLSGLAKIVWQPDQLTREHREVLFAHRNAVTDATRCRNRIHSFLNEHCIRLKKGTQLMLPGSLAVVLATRHWSMLQQDLITQRFEQLWRTEKQRKQLERTMVRELAAHPQWSRLWRLMGVRHRVAFALMAIVGDIKRFPSAKKLAGYFGLAPRKDQSGNNIKGWDLGLGKNGRSDVRSLLLQSAQNALNQKESPLHKWGWKLVVRKSRNEAVVAVARKLTVAIWHLLMGHFSALAELDDHLHIKLLKLATLLGKAELKEMGLVDREAWVTQQTKLIQLST
jgi:transposase